jgi:CspA family cold shock protein
LTKPQREAAAAGGGEELKGVPMLHGRISVFNEERGWGFIKRDDGAPDVFVHIREMVPGCVPRPGAAVTFDIVQDQRSGKPRAVRVRTI